MSFTAEVKDELSRVKRKSTAADMAELAALIRICGTLSFRGPGRFSIRVSTETGAVARMVLGLTHDVFNLKTKLTFRQSILHKTRNYLIEIPEQDNLQDALVKMGILTPEGSLAQGINQDLLCNTTCCDAFIRGTFLAGGFIADPRGDFHLEIAVTGDQFANQLVELVNKRGVHARLNHRRGAFALYLKSYDDIVALLLMLGARRMSRTLIKVRQMKSLKNDVNRRVNAEIANQARSTDAAASQLDLIDFIDKTRGIQNLPASLRMFCELRRDFPELSLRDLGQQCTPALSKSALYHRLLRLQEIERQLKAEHAMSEAVKH